MSAEKGGFVEESEAFFHSGGGRQLQQVAFVLRHSKMADELSRIQTEVKWRAAVQTEAQRKHNSYPWILPCAPATRPTRPAMRYQPTPRPSLVDLDKENLWTSPEAEAVTFRAPLEDLPRQELMNRVVRLKDCRDMSLCLESVKKGVSEVKGHLQTLKRAIEP